MLWRKDAISTVEDIQYYGGNTIRALEGFKFCGGEGYQRKDYGRIPTIPWKHVCGYYLHSADPTSLDTLHRTKNLRINDE